jgi:hypothetical protein
LFELYDAGGPGTAVWTGPDDQTSAVQIVYDQDNVYFGFVVTDEYHENAANSAWNGDSVQLMIANASQDQQVALYNYALGGTEESLGQIIVMHEAGPGGTEAVVTRNSATKRTIYEIKLPKAALGLDSLVYGTQFGLGMAINDGDKDAPGQQGWGGLGAHSIVFGKTPSQTALVTLGIGGTGADLIFLSAINSTFRGFSFRATDKGSSVVDPASAKLIIDGETVPLTVSPKVLDATDFTYTRPSPYPASSEHTYSIEVKDTQGHIVSSSGSFKMPSPWFPAENLPGPRVANKAWGVRHVFGAGTISDIPTVIATLKAVGTPGFTGAFVDTTSDVINYGNAGLFPEGLPYPDAVINHPSGLWSGEDFIQFAVGHIDIPELGDYTFGIHSDDGFGMRIRGGEAIRVSGNGQLDPADWEAVVHPATTSDSNTRAVYRLKKGVYRIEFFWFERGGGDHGELYAAKGSFTNDADTDQWRLVGDNTPSREFFRLGVDANGWTVVSSDVGGDPLNSWFEAFMDLDATGGNPTKYDVLNVGDPQTNAGTQPFPKNTAGDDDDYVLRANATLVVPAAGTYIIGFNSDDGGYMKIPGQTFIEIIANATGSSIIGPADTVTCDALTGSSLTTATITLAAGNYPIEVGMFERGGGSFLTASGAQVGSPSVPLLAKNGTGAIRTGEALQLTDRATGIVADIVLTITRSGNNVIVQWTPTGGTLESTPALGPAATWTGVGTANPATIAIGTANRFYRVRQ